MFCLYFLIFFLAEFYQKPKKLLKIIFLIKKICKEQKIWRTFQKSHKISSCQDSCKVLFISSSLEKTFYQQKFQQLIVIDNPWKNCKNVNKKIDFDFWWKIESDALYMWFNKVWDQFLKKRLMFKLLLNCFRQSLLKLL
jgi:hypothetical protein